MNIIELTAKVCHQVNKTYCESIGDFSQPDWKDAPDWQKQSAINGVKFHMNNPESKPEDSHNNWMAEKVLNGWVYGEKKDSVQKTHPCLVDYDRLPKEQQAKDALFIAVVRSILG